MCDISNIILFNGLNNKYLINNIYIVEIHIDYNLIFYGINGGCIKTKICTDYAIINEIYSENTNTLVDLIYDYNIDTTNLIEIALSFIKKIFNSVKYIKFKFSLNDKNGIHIINPAYSESYILSYYYFCFYGNIWLNNICSDISSSIKYSNMVNTLTNSAMMSWDLFDKHIIFNNNIINYELIKLCYNSANTYLIFFQTLKTHLNRNDLLSTLGGYNNGLFPTSWYNRFILLLNGSIVVSDFCNTQIIYKNDIKHNDLIINNYSKSLNINVWGYKIL